MKWKSDTPLPIIAWWGFQTLEFIAGKMEAEGEGSVSIYQTLDPYMKERRWNKPVRSDVINFMLIEGWIHRRSGTASSYPTHVLIEPTGRRELESPKQLQGLAIVNPVAGLSEPAEQRELLSRLALVIELDSRSTRDPEIRTRAEQMARDIEEDVSGDREKRDFKTWLEMAKDLSQIAANANSALPLLHHLLSVILR